MYTCIYVDNNCVFNFFQRLMNIFFFFFWYIINYFNEEQIKSYIILMFNAIFMENTVHLLVIIHVDKKS